MNNIDETGIKSMQAFILIPPVSIATALVIVDWYIIPQLTVVTLLSGLIPLLFYIILCLIFFSTPVYLAYYITLLTLGTGIKSNRIRLIGGIIAGTVLSGLCIYAVPGIWRNYFGAEVFILTCLTSLILFPFCMKKVKPLLTPGQVKAVCIAQTILSVMVFVLSSNGCQFDKHHEEPYSYTPFIFQNGPGYKNLHLTLLPTGKKSCVKYPQDYQYDIKFFCDTTGMKSEDIITLHRYGYYNTGVCIKVRTSPATIKEYMETIPQHKFNDAKEGICFKADLEEWYAPRDIQGQYVKLDGNRLMGEQRFVLFNREMSEISLFVF